MKTAKLHIRVIEFSCPECGEFISAEDGPHMWPLEGELPQTIKCDTCDAELKIPERARKLK